MARQTKGGKYSEADAFARQHGINAKRTRQVFKRIAQDYCEHSLMVRVNKSKVKDVLDKALRYLPIEEALALFEREDIKKLAERVDLTTDFVFFAPTIGPPLHNLKDWEYITESFLSHLERNRDSLIKTGHPRTKFELSGTLTVHWLDWRLTDLYYVKLPCRVIPPSPYKDGDNEFLYQFENSPELVSMSVEPCPPLPYVKAPLIKGLTPEDAARIKADRGKLFDLKVSIIKKLLQAVRLQTADNLWKNCLHILTKTLTVDDVDFYLYIDYLFHNEYEVSTGGLANLLDVIGHYEKEITIGTLAKTRDALGDLIKPKDCPRKPNYENCPRLAIYDYFQVVGRREKEILDNALDAQESAFWTDFRRRVNEALENEFYEEVIITTKVKRKLAHQFEPNVRTYSDWVKAHLEATGQPPQLSVSIGSVRQPITSSSDEGNVFRKKGDYWQIVYEGKEIFLEDAKGLHYIHCLLQNPEQEFHVTQLISILSAHEPSKMSEKQLKEDGLNISVGFGDAGEVMDPKYISECKRQVKKLQEDLEEAKSSGNWEQTKEIQKQIDFIKNEMSSAIDLGGKVRKVADSNEKARKAVTNCIQDSLKKIKSENHALWQRLYTSIKTGHFCSYKPEKPIQWSLD